MGGGLHPHLGLDHVDAPGAEGLHAIVDVHDALTLRHVQHHIQNDVTPCAASARAGERAPAARSEAWGGSPGPQRRREETWGPGPNPHHTGDGGHGGAWEEAARRVPGKVTKDRGGAGPWGWRGKEGWGECRPETAQLGSCDGGRGTKVMLSITQECSGLLDVWKSPTHPSKPYTLNPIVSGASRKCQAFEFPEQSGWTLTKTPFPAPWSLFIGLSPYLTVSSLRARWGQTHLWNPHI